MKSNSQTPPTIKNPVVRAILIVIAFISLGLGVIGMIFPILPTTPFLLISAAIFARTSVKFHNWLYASKLFGKLLSDYHDKKGLTISYKLYILILLWISMTLTIIFAINVLFVRIILFLIAITVTLHIVGIRTLEE